MRVIFLCSSLESGRDGVGDYTSRLAVESFQHGVQPRIIALNDRHASNVVATDTTSGDHECSSLRLPSTMTWRGRLALAEEYLSRFPPDWVSLQFVPYGFHEKGIVWNLDSRLESLVKEHRVHVMFHELWLGAYRGAGLWNRLIGSIQRAGILRMVRRVSPAIVTTSNEPYAQLLRDAGIPASVLPLFGNIPLAREQRSDWLESTLKLNERGEHWIFALFGTLHPIWPPEPLFSYLTEAAEQSGKRVIIAGIGRIGPGETLWNRLTCEYGDVFRFVHLGEQPAERISEFLQAADFGIAASPWDLIGKSGTVASMIEHGLPVIVNRDDVRFSTIERTNPFSSLLIKMDEKLPSRLRSVRRAEPKSMLPEVARLMLSYLGKSRAATHSNVTSRQTLLSRESAG
jgi:glycosyltransferase involved in cell wall biosynthesis